MFPRWANRLRLALVVLVLVVPPYVVLLVAYGASPRTTDVGYQPAQPLPYSHAQHAGKLGIDCRYCHTTVEYAALAAVPPTQTCVNCHANIMPDSRKMLKVRESYATGLPIEWVRVHDLPDFVYFDHSAHVRRGVGCVSCHGRVDKMEVVYQTEPLSMGWCLDCHRKPEEHLRPTAVVTQMDWVPFEERVTLGRRVRRELNIDPSTDCSTCHR